VRIENDFIVKAQIEEVWAHLLDVERIAPCAPGAELTEVVDDRTWKGKVAVKIGPVSLSFAGTVAMQERDDQGHRVVLKAQGMEQRGKGAATAVVSGHLEEAEGGTRVAMETDLTISGAVAQYGRGMVLDISQRLTREFARCLEANMQAGAQEESAGAAGGGAQDNGGGSASAMASPSPPPRPAQASAATAKPVKGFRLGLWALWRAVVRFFRRLFGRGRV
jgi:carbon monoxide dehydrogenase subunit G